MIQQIKATKYDYHIICVSKNCERVYPLLRDSNGDETMFLISPHHGRSYVVNSTENKYIVSKGNGLSYSQFRFLNTGEFGDDTWGLLLRKDAIRDFNLGQEISELGIKTNTMECVIELDFDVAFEDGHMMHPVLLQYSVESPYRICDSAYMPYTEIEKQVAKWKSPNADKLIKRHLIGADILIQNLRILHDNDILHNAIHPQNYTWALELLDFELACSPTYPYDAEDDQRHVKDLFAREIIQTYDIINHIAWSVGEEVDYKSIDNLFRYYGFNISSLSV